MAIKNIQAALTQLQKSNPVAYRRAYFLNDLRKGLRALRGKRSQDEIGERSDRDQSEISRLENGMTEFTRIGSILDYVEACQGKLSIGLYDESGKPISVFETTTASDLTSHHLGAEADKELSARLLEARSIHKTVLGG